MIYFDNAATTFPKPVSVYDAVNTALTSCGANPGRGGYKSAMRADETVYLCREKIGEFFSADPDNVIFTKNCTESLNTAIKGAVLHYFRKGIIPHVITTDLEHNSVLRPLYKLREYGLCRYTVIDTGNSDEDVLSAVKNALCRDTRIIVMTGASNAFGRRLPIEKTGDFARKNGLFFIADISQTAGSERLTLSSSGADILCMPGHKGLMGPMGTGVMIVRSGVITDTLTEGGTGSVSSSLSQPDFLPDRYESGTLNLPGIAGLYAGVSYVMENLDTIRKTEITLLRKLWTELKNTERIILYTPLPDNCAPVLSFNIHGLDSSSAGTLLSENNIAVRSGFHCAFPAHKHYGTDGIGTVRISLSGLNTETQTDNFMFILKKLLNNL